MARLTKRVHSRRENQQLVADDFILQEEEPLRWSRNNSPKNVGPRATLLRLEEGNCRIAELLDARVVHVLPQQTAPHHRSANDLLGRRLGEKLIWKFLDDVLVLLLGLGQALGHAGLRRHEVQQEAINHFLNQFALFVAAESDFAVIHLGDVVVLGQINLGNSILRLRAYAGR
mgnify:CR=1 FL=1